MSNPQASLQGSAVYRKNLLKWILSGLDTVIKDIGGAIIDHTPDLIQTWPLASLYHPILTEMIVVLEAATGLGGEAIQSFQTRFLMQLSVKYYPTSPLP